MTETTIRAARRTFRGPGGGGQPNLPGLPGVHRTDSLPPVVEEIERYDTDDRRLAAAGIRLELYRGDESSWRLELPDGNGTERIQMPAPRDAGAELSGELDELVRGAARERAVRPAARLRRVRTRTRLLGDGDAELAVVLHDEVTLATLGRSTEVNAWTEVTIDRGEGAPDDVDVLLDAVAARVAEAGLRPAAPGEGVELDRLLRPPSRRGKAGKKGSAGRVLMDYVAGQAERIAAEDLRVRRGEPDSVHQMRVASRRLRSALRAYRGLLDRTQTDPVSKGLRDLGRALAPARDAEVLQESIAADLAALPPDLRLGPVQAEATRHFARAEAEGRARVLTTLDSPAYAKLRRDLDDLVEQPPLTRKAASKKGSKTLRAASTRKRLDGAVKRAVATGADADLHEARKSAKRLRYANEVTGSRPKWLKGLQQALGEHQDAVIARHALRELGAAAENGFSFGLLYERAGERAADVRRRLPKLAKQLRR